MVNTGGYRGAYKKADGTRYGPQVDFVAYLAKTYSFKLQEVTIPVELETDLKVTLSNSTFTRCVAAVGMGFVDICVGSFDETARRLSLSRMSPNIVHENKYIYSKKDTVTLWSKLSAPFQPFSNGVWLMIVAVSAHLTYPEP